MAEFSERVLFDKSGVKVTQHRLIVENTVYAIQNITSIRHDISKSSKSPDDFYRNIALAAGVVLLIGVTALNADAPGALTAVLLVAGVVLVVYSLVGRIYHDSLPELIRYTPPPASHTIILTSSAQERDALSSTDEVFVSEVLAALNEALTMRQ